MSATNTVLEKPVAEVEPDAAPKEEIPGLVSVIIPTFNRADTLPRAMMSVLGQSYSNLELLIMDDGSTDNTAELVAAINDPRVRYFRLPGNGGASRARNAGLEQARGEFIAFQDSDDEWLMEKLRRQVEAARSAGDVPVTVFHTKIQYGRDDRTSEYGARKVSVLPLPDTQPDSDFRKNIQKINIVSTQCLLVNRKAMDLVPRFDTRLVNNNDWGYAIELMYKTKVIFLDEPLVMTYLQTNSISRIKRPGVRCQLLLVQKMSRFEDADMRVMGEHYGRIGWGLAKLGSPKLARRLLLRGVRLAPTYHKNWARLLVNELRILVGVKGSRKPQPA